MKEKKVLETRKGEATEFTSDKNGIIQLSKLTVLLQSFSHHLLQNVIIEGQKFYVLTGKAWVQNVFVCVKHVSFKAL